MNVGSALFDGRADQLIDQLNYAIVGRGRRLAFKAMVLHLLIISDSRFFALDQRINQVKRLQDNSAGRQGKLHRTFEYSLHLFCEWCSGRIGGQYSHTPIFYLYRQDHLPSEVFQRYWSKECRVNLADIRIDNLEAEFF